MGLLIKYLKTRKVNFYLLIASGFFELIGLIIYIQTGINAFVTKLDYMVIGFAIGGLCCCLLPLIFSKYRIVFFFPYFFFLFSFLNFLTSQANYIANVFVSIDGSSFSLSFIITALMFFLSSCCCMASGCLTKDKIYSDSSNKELNYVKK